MHNFAKSPKILTKSISDFEATLNSYHRHVDIAGMEFHVDLLVDQGLGVGVEVGADLGDGHLDVFLQVGGCQKVI